MVTLEDIRQAQTGLAGIATRTELRALPSLSDLAGTPVFLKLENQQPTGAFKLRGAWTAISRLSPPQLSSGVITYSSGNHGQAVAYAAERKGIRAVVVMPETAPARKVEGVKRWGGEVVFAGTTSETREVRALELALEEGLTVIPPFDHPDVIAGQGTVGIEILEDLPSVATVVVPVGGGGLAAGVATAVKSMSPGTVVVTVEPENAACLHEAIAAGKPVRLEESHSVADGLLPISVGELNFQHLKGNVESVVVADQDIMEATRWLYEHEGLTVEPSGAAATAALRTGVFQPQGPTVLVVSGGNIDPSRIMELSAN